MSEFLLPDGSTRSPADWYWIVGARTDVYSSSRADYVATDDAAYVSFLAAGGLATVIDTEDNLRGALNGVGLSFRGEAIAPLLVDRPRVVAARCRLVAAAFSIGVGAVKAIPWTAARIDPLAMWAGPAPGNANPERITIRQPGIYRFTLGIRFTEPAAPTGYRALSFTRGLGGSPEDLGTSRIACAPAPSPETSYGFSEFIEPAAAGDVLRAFSQHGHTAALSAQARITIERVE
jgi:hypothetical protein